MMHVHNASAHVLRTYGTEEQMRAHLPELARAQRIGAFLLSEPHAGSDTAAIRTTAKREGDFALVVAATGAPGVRDRFSLFIADPRDAGYQCLRIENKLGQHTAHTAQIHLDNLRVPATNMLGEEGRGYGKALALLSDGRIAIAALSIGIARAALEAAIRYAKERDAYGKPIAELQAIRFDLADMATQIDVARQFTLYAARLTDARLPAIKEAAMAKLFASEMAEKVCSAALQVHGGYGYVNDFPVERYYRDVRVTKIYEGTSHIQRLIIARQILAG